VRVLSRLFRRRFLQELRAAFGAGELSFFSNLIALKEQDAFERYLAPLQRSEWVVYAKRPFAGPSQVLAYLARYTHRVAISNSRLISFSDGKVEFRWKDYRQAGKAKVMTLAAGEFIRRFLMHTLPGGFHRIRYYGLFANGHRAEKLAQCRELLNAPSTPPMKNADAENGGTSAPTDAVRLCPCCGGRMLLVETFDATQAEAVRSRYTIRLDSS
jgi:hypothetical protein